MTWRVIIEYQMRGSSIMLLKLKGNTHKLIGALAVIGVLIYSIFALLPVETGARNNGPEPNKAYTKDKDKVTLETEEDKNDKYLVTFTKKKDTDLYKCISNNLVKENKAEITGITGLSNSGDTITCYIGYISKEEDFLVGNEYSKDNIDQYKRENRGFELTELLVEYDIHGPIVTEEAKSKKLGDEKNTWMKKGDSFEISFYISDDNRINTIDNDSVKVSIGTIEKKAAKVSEDKDKAKFKVEFAVDELTSNVNEDGSFTYKIQALDILGNQLDATNNFNTGNTSVKFDGEKPTTPIISTVSIDEEHRIETISIGGSTDKLSGVVEYEYQIARIDIFGNPIWDGWTKCKEGFEKKLRGQHRVKARAIDAAGNVSDTTERSVGMDVDPPEARDVSISKVEENSNNNDVDYVKLGDKFKVSFKLYDNSGISDQSVKVDINNVVVPAKKLGDKYYEAEFQVAEKNSPPVDNSSEASTDETGKAEETEQLNLVAGEDNKEFEFKIYFEDTKGNSNKDNPVTETSGSGKDSKVVYYAPIKAAIDSFSSIKDEGDTSLVKNGEKVKVTFTANHAVDIAEGKIAGRKAEIRHIDENFKKWEAIYTIEGGELKDGENIPFSFTLKDAAGNTPIAITEANTENKVIYMAPIEVKVTDFSSSNRNRTYAKNGDKITVAFTTNHEVTVDKIKIAGQKLDTSKDSKELTTKDNKTWTAVYEIKDGDLEDNSPIDFEFTVNDAAGNTPVTTKKDGELKDITYMAPIKATITGFASNNRNSEKVARNGDIIQLTFTTTHPVKVSRLSIGGKELSGEAKSSDNMNWSIDYLVTPGALQDQQLIPYSFTLTDAAANTPFTFTSGQEDRNVKYFEPIKVSNLKIVSNNVKDGSKYAKDGDTITVTFDTQHKTHISVSKIAGKNIEFTSKNNEGKSWTGKYTLKNGDIVDLQQVSFQFNVDDEAANDTVSKNHQDSAVINKLKYYAPITVNATMSSSGSNKAYAKNGDTIKVSFTTNHEARVNSAVFFNERSGRATGNDTSSLSAEYTIPAGERVLKEDEIPFAINVEDPAGNTNSFNATNDGSKVIYDRTSPVAIIRPAFNGFSGKALNVTVSCSDKNIDPKAVSVTLNGKELMSAAERAAVKTTFDKAVNLQEEGEYDLKVVSTDLAGNKSDPNIGMKVILDITNPKFTSMKLDLTKAITVKKGFVISEFIKIDEKHIKSITCTLTDMLGSVEWDINKPIETDGKKTINLLAEDMAGNTSNLTYDIYVDGTVPKPIIKESVTGRSLSPGDNVEPFISEMSLEISLEKLHIGSENPDKFTQLKLTDENGNLIEDILAAKTPVEDIFKVPIKAFGKYNLVLEAEDDVGNKTELTSYSFEFKDKTLLLKFYENKPLFYSTMPLVVVIVISAVVFIINKLRRKSSIEEAA